MSKAQQGMMESRGHTRTAARTGAAATPGKRTLVESIPDAPAARAPAQRPDAATAGAGAPGSAATVHADAQSTTGDDDAHGHGGGPGELPFQPDADAHGTAGDDAAPGHGTGPGELPFRREMEVAFGEDFSRVGVRTGRAGELAALGARATATGEDLSFADAHPERRTVAHELAHVVQHRRHGAGTGGISRPDDDAEREADAIAAAVDAGGKAPDVRHPAVTRTAGPADDVARRHGLRSTAPRVQGADPPHDAVAFAENAPTSARLGTDRAMDAQSLTSAGVAQAAVSPAHPATGGNPATEVSTQTQNAMANDDRAADRALEVHPAPDAGPQGTTPPAAAHGGRSADRGAQRGAGSPALETHAPAGGTADAHHPTTAAASIALRGAGNALAGFHGARLTELGATAQRVAHDITASHDAARAWPVAVPRAATLAPETAPPKPTAAAIPPPSPERRARPIEHARHDTGPAAPGRISAGPRPRVPLTGPADPAHGSAAVRAGQSQLEARLAASHARSTADHGESRLHAQVQQPAPPPLAPLAVPRVAAPAIPDGPWRSLPPEARKQLDQRAAPELGRRLARLTADAQADGHAADAELAGVQARHEAQRSAHTARAQAQRTALRAAGNAQVTGLRGQWQAQNQAARDAATAEIHADHAAAEARVQDAVRTSEARGHAILTGAENDASATRTRSDGRVAAIRAAAEARAQAARAQGHGPDAGRSIARKDDGSGGGGDAQAQQILADAEADIDAEIASARAEISALLAQGDALTQQQIDDGLARAQQHLAELRQKLADKLQQTLGDRFPRIEATYLGQIDALLGDVSTQLTGVTTALANHDQAGAAAAWTAATAVIDRRTTRLHGTLQDAAALATFQTLDEALGAYGITVNGWDDGSQASGEVRQDILLEAIRVESALRGADRKDAGGKGLLATGALAAPGAAFKALFNQGQGFTINAVGGKGGAFTPTADHTDVYGLSPDRTDWIANARQFQLGHELGHAFNAGMLDARAALLAAHPDLPLAPYQKDGPEKGAFDIDPVTYGGQVIAGGDASRRYVPQGPEFAGILNARTQPGVLDAMRARYEAQGMRMSTQFLSYGKQLVDKKQGPALGPLLDMPYQQDLAQSNGEWFADVFVNWANGSLADNGQGAAIDAWMNQHMQGWIEMGLTADDARGTTPK